MTTVFVVVAGLLINPPMFGARDLPQREIVINVVGDVHGESHIQRGAIPALKEFFTDGDLNIFNLETSVTKATEKEDKEYNFKTDPLFLTALKDVGFNIANLANNHTYDFGQKGFIDTIDNLERADITYVGGGLNSEAAYQGRVYLVNGLKIGVLGLAKVHGGPASIATKGKAGTTNGYDSISTDQAIVRLRDVSDVLIILTHWGEEGSFCPRASEISSAKRWQRLGADIIIGSHTHTLQPVTLENNKLLAYSLGNFIFYSSKAEYRSTGILKIRISPEKKISYELVPFLINNLTKVPEMSLEVGSNPETNKIYCDVSAH